MNQTASDPPPCCGQCRFWLSLCADPASGAGEQGESHTFGTCHKRAPVILQFDRSERGRWPETLVWEGCGDFEPRDPRRP